MIGTKIILDDQSYIPSLNIKDNTIRPIVFMGFTSDKGTEDYAKYQGKSFFKQYGNISFAKHGQPLLQAANVINNGGIVYAKRVVDPTSRLAMLGVVGHIKETQKQENRIKKNTLTGAPELGPDGAYVYEDLFWKQSEVDTISDPAKRPLYTEAEAGADKVAAMYKVAQVNYTVEVLEEQENTFGNDAKRLAEAFYQKVVKQGANTFPLFVITDNGRGVSNKVITISSNLTLSRSARSNRYVIDIMEDGEVLESIVFSLNPDEVDGSYNLFFDSVVKRLSSQIKCFGFEDKVNEFYKGIAKISGIDETELRSSDIITAKTWKSATYKTFEVVSSTNDGQSTVKLDRISGHALQGGYNGKDFGDAPIANYTGVNDTTSTYAKELTKVYDGTFNDDIYDIDNNPIDIVVDANYPHITKRAIEALCSFRQDVFYFRDMGTSGLDNVLGITMAQALNTSGNNRYTGTYCQYYDIYDPYSKKQVTVTIGYSIARLVCMHFANGRSLVCAGESNGWTIPEIIEGTLNFVPKVTPSMNQVDEMDDLRINYGKYLNNLFQLQTEYTSQPDFTQLSFINNVLSVQELIKDIRVTCPKARYKFITGADFDRYKEDVIPIIDRQKSKYASIDIDFEQNSIYAANKIVYAVIKVTFKDFAQAEIFRIIALPIGDSAYN